DSELTKLLKQRHNAALEDVRVRYERFTSGRSTLEGVLNAMQRMAKAGVEMAQMQAERLRYLQMALDGAKAMENIERNKVEAGAEPVQLMHRATAHRLTADIELLRAQSPVIPTAPGQ